MADASKALPQETTRKSGRIQRVLSTLSGQILLPDDKPVYLQGVTSLFTDVFLSYSRKDKAFVRQLFQALADDNRPVWVDWEDIPPTVDWQQEIYTGIEAASTFVFVLSPDSVSSVPCQKELEHALQTKKRIIPLVYRKVAPETVNEALQRSNWISFEHREMFDFAMKQLLFALDTDVDYWHHSARLLTGAKEWQRQGKERSSTLRGKELKAAEHWLGEGARKTPPPGPPVTEFIAASRKQRKRSRVLTIAILLVVLLTAGAASGYFLNNTLVTTLADSGPGSLRQAITNAAPGSTISFAPWVMGTIQLTETLHIQHRLSIRGPGAASLGIGSVPKQDYRVMLDVGATATLSGLTFKSGLTNSGTLTLDNSLISGNRVPDAYGGGIENYLGTLMLLNSTVADNTALEGGGIYSLGGTLTLTNSLISGNTGIDGGGGIAAGGRLTLRNSRVSGNTAEVGGGIDNSGTLTLLNSTVSGNTSTFTGGGIATGGTLTLRNSTVADNTAKVGGGIDNIGTLTLLNSTVSGNTSTLNGGGIENGGSGVLTLTNSTVSGNSATGEGGGLLNVTSQGEPPPSSTLTFSTLSGNRATSSGGMAAAEVDSYGNEVPLTNLPLVVLRNSLVAGNQSNTGPAITGSLTTEGYNLYQNVTGTTFLDPDKKHSTDILLDPSITLAQFIDSTLRNNTGPNGKPAPTQTLALLPAPANPAIDVIPAAECTITFTVTDLKGNLVIDPVTNRPLTISTDHDQRGMPRPGTHKTACDIGAYESSG